MQAPTHLCRRGAVYHWRRRLQVRDPAERRRVLQVCLLSTDRILARRLAAELTHMSEELFDEMRRSRLSPDEVKAILVAVARRHSEKLEFAATVDRSLSRTEPMSGQRGLSRWRAC
jgi:hypothetical protein